MTVASILVYLNMRLLIGEAMDFFVRSESVFWKGAIITGGVFLVVLLGYIVVRPMTNKVKTENLKLKS